MKLQGKGKVSLAWQVSRNPLNHSHCLHKKTSSRWQDIRFWSLAHLWRCQHTARETRNAGALSSTYRWGMREEVAGWRWACAAVDLDSWKLPFQFSRTLRSVHWEGLTLSSVFWVPYLPLKGVQDRGDIQSPSLHASGALTEPAKRNIITPKPGTTHIQDSGWFFGHRLRQSVGWCKAPGHHRDPELLLPSEFSILGFPDNV